MKGEELASQPTLSRFENAVDRADLYRMGVALADTVIERHRRRLKRQAKRITIDLDPTDDPTHGAQQQTSFNGHYDTWCYLPVAGFLTFNEEPEYLVAMGKNKVLERRAARESGETEHLYRETRHAAGTWEHRRRVIIKAEVVRHPGRKPKNNPRFVVTNLQQSPQHLYEVIYCERANVENRIKELHHGLEIDRTSCAEC